MAWQVFRDGKASPSPGGEEDIFKVRAGAVQVQSTHVQNASLLGLNGARRSIRLLEADYRRTRLPALLQGGDGIGDALFDDPVVCGIIGTRPSLFLGLICIDSINDAARSGRDGKPPPRPSTPGGPWRRCLRR